VGGEPGAFLMERCEQQMPVFYDAFISYSHARDKPIAAALQSAVQRLGKAWHQRRVLRVFRDDTSLSATPSLWPAIEQALDRSQYLILLTSPEAASSRWVNKEVAYWLEHKSADTLLIALTDGELVRDDAGKDFSWGQGTPLPRVLMGRFPTEPKWVDLRAYRNGANPRAPNLSSSPPTSPPPFATCQRKTCSRRKCANSAGR